MAGDNERWRCYVCDPKPLLPLIEHCTAIMEALARQEKQESDKRRKPDTTNRLITGTQYNSSGAKIGSGSKQVAQPVSVIQNASLSTITKSRIQPSSDAGKQQPMKLPTRTVASMLYEQKHQLPSKMTNKTVASLLAEQKVRPGMTPPASSQAQVASLPAVRTARPLLPHVQNVVTSQNVLVVLDRLQSATNSMNVFLQSLRLDARKNAVGNTQANLEKRREIAGKLTRAYAAYTRSFQEVTAHTSPTSNAAAISQTPRVNAAKPQQGSVVMRAPPASASNSAAASRPATNQRSSVVSRPPVKSASSEVIEISDSEDDRGNSSAAVRSKNVQQLPSQTNTVIPAAGSKVLESHLSRAAPVKVTTQNSTNSKKRAPSPDAASGQVPAAPQVAAKRVCLDKSSDDRSSKPAVKPGATSGEECVMFDGGVEEIPQDNASDSTDHHLQMYCVEVSEDSDDDDTPLSGIKVANGKVPTAVGRRERSLLEAELTRSVSTSRSVVS